MILNDSRMVILSNKVPNPLPGFGQMSINLEIVLPTSSAVPLILVFACLAIGHHYGVIGRFELVGGCSAATARWGTSRETITTRNTKSLIQSRLPRLVDCPFGVRTAPPSHFGVFRTTRLSCHVLNHCSTRVPNITGIQAIGLRSLGALTPPTTFCAALMWKVLYSSWKPSQAERQLKMTGCSQITFAKVVK